jgi:transcription antitermination factor NusG
MFIAQLKALTDQDPCETGWWAVYTRHQHEKTAAEIMAAKGCEVFLPLYSVIRRWKDRRMKLSLPLFPCYLFVRARLAHRLQIISTPGVNMILRRGEQFAEMTPAEILTLQRAVDGPFQVEPHPFLQCGERIRVTRGALEGVEGILVRKKNLCRLVLAVDILARAASVEVDAADVMPVDRAHARLYSPSDMALCMPAGLQRSAAASGA